MQDEGGGGHMQDGVIHYTEQFESIGPNPNKCQFSVDWKKSVRASAAG